MLTGLKKRKTILHTDAVERNPGLKVKKPPEGGFFTG